MDKIFAEMFSKQPDEITGGDYYYRSPWLEDIYAEKAKSMGFASVDEFFEWRDGKKIFSFRHKWLQDRSNPFFCDPCMPHLLEKSETGNIDFKFEETIQKIADENKAFMDIASSENMGFAPYVVKMNPNIPCLVTDIDAHAMKYLRVCINKHLTGYNINIASFDNYGIPIKDNSLDCITSNYGISSSGGNPAARPKTNTPQLHAGSEKAIDEVYRVLKPGGCYVAIEIERECDFDLRRMYEYHGEHGSLFGLYTYDEIQAVCGLLTEEPW
ncbi:MAG: class I SAM-dependent methyltransferase, partial [Oscillospiraceae bacterium]|nr:class I SAM-dependent methyltransferase [Oscillospiraceae bacterium]